MSDSLRDTVMKKGAALDFAVTRELARLNLKESQGLVLRGCTALGSERVFPWVAILFAGWSWWLHDARSAIVLILALVVTKQSIHLTKRFFVRSRPPFSPEVRRLSSSSFPSGHAMAGVAIYGIIAEVVVRSEPAAAPAALLVASIVAAMIGISRVALGVHWATDVLAGYVLGSIVLVAGALAL